MARTFGRDLYRLRKARGLSQREVGRFLGGYTHVRIHQWERAPATDASSTPPEDSAIILDTLAALPVVKSSRGTDARKTEIGLFSQALVTAVRKAIQPGPLMRTGLPEPAVGLP